MPAGQEYQRGSGRRGRGTDRREPEGLEERGEGGTVQGGAEAQSKNAYAERDQSETEVEPYGMKPRERQGVHDEAERADSDEGQPNG